MEREYFRIYDLELFLEVSFKGLRIFHSKLLLKLPNELCRPSSFAGFQAKAMKFSLKGLGPFYCSCHKALLDIPFGERRSYGQIATAIKSPKSSRAVGSFCKNNQFPFLVPCHRVIKSDGGIGDYSAPGGSDTKKKLLEYEVRSFTKLFL